METGIIKQRFQVNILRIKFICLGTLLIMIVGLLNSCKVINNNLPESEATNVDATLVSISVTPANPTIADPLTQQFTATGTYSNGVVTDITSSVEWVSENPVVAVVSNSKNDPTNPKGKALALYTGTTTITARSDRVIGSTTLSVTSASLEIIEVTPSYPRLPLSLAPTIQFSATGIYTDGTKVDLTEFASWKSSKPSTATVSNSLGLRGLVASLSDGTTDISAEFSSLMGSTQLELDSSVDISADAPWDVLLYYPINPSMTRGTQLQLNATAILNNGKTLDMTSVSVWSSSDTSIAAISNATGSNGITTADPINFGTSDIYAAFGDISGDTTQLTVTQAYLYGLEIYPANHSIAFGLNYDLKAIGIFKYGDAYYSQDLTESVVWSVSDTSVATICNAPGCIGRVTPTTINSVLQRSTTVSVQSPLSSTVTGTTKLYINPPRWELTGISITPTNSKVYLDSVHNYEAIGTFSDGSDGLSDTTQNITRKVVWSSSDPSVAVIGNGANSAGKAVYLSAGQATITAVLGAISGSRTVTVKSDDYSVTTITMTPTTSALGVGTIQQLNATGDFFNGTDTFVMDLTDLVYWQSSDPTKAIVSNSEGSKGMVTGVSAGTATVNAHWKTQDTGGTYVTTSGSAELTVASDLVSIEFSPTIATLSIGSSRQYSGVARYTSAPGLTQDATKSAIWFSSRPSVASVSNDQKTKGIITGHSRGTVTITVRLGSQSTTLTLTVQ